MGYNLSTNFKPTVKNIVDHPYRSAGKALAYGGSVAAANDLYNNGGKGIGRVADVGKRVGFNLWDPRLNAKANLVGWGGFTGGTGGAIGGLQRKRIY
jgi:hypothetical protein